MQGLFYSLARTDRWRPFAPRWAVRLARRVLPLEGYQRSEWARHNPFVGTRYETSFDPDSGYTVGIVFDRAHYHRYFQQACHDMGVGYRVVDITSDDWLERISGSACRVWLVWPMLYTSVLKDVVDERLALMADVLGLQLMPSPDEIRPLDNKRRVRDWLQAHQVPHPRTWCFHDRDEALDFAMSVGLPVVFKALRGAVSQGVRICRTRADVVGLVRQCFGAGFARPRGDRRDRQWGVVLFQEYLGDVEEHRVVRVDESYLYVRKVRRGDFHSGSGAMCWGTPKRDLLDLARRVTEAGRFTSMDVDVFETRDGLLLVNELHALFHGPRVPDSPDMGRYTHNEASDTWLFEAGNHYRNYCANLRLVSVLRGLGERRPERLWAWLDKPVW